MTASDERPSPRSRRSRLERDARGSRDDARRERPVTSSLGTLERDHLMSRSLDATTQFDSRRRRKSSPFARRLATSDAVRQPRYNPSKKVHRAAVQQLLVHRLVKAARWHAEMRELEKDTLDPTPLMVRDRAGPGGGGCA